MRNLFHAAAFTSLSTLVTLVVGIARTKVVAVSIGAYGVGLSSQVYTALSLSSTLVSTGFANAIVRGTAADQTARDVAHASTLLATGYASVLVLAGAGMLVLLAGHAFVADSLFGNNAPVIALIALAVAAPFSAIASLEQAVTQGLKGVRLLALANSVAAVLGLLLVWPLVAVFGIAGALAHIGIFSVATCLVNLWARHRAARETGFAVTPFASPSLRALKKLVSYGSANAVAGIVTTANLLFVRSYIINVLGVDQNGIYQVLWAIPAQSVSLVLNTLSFYAFPLISGLRGAAEVNDAINTSLRFTLATATPLLVTLVMLSHPLVVLLYSPEFSPAATLLPLQLAGDFLKAIVWALGLSLLGRGHLVAFTTLDVVWSVVFTGCTLLLTPHVGLSGAVISYVLAYGVHALATFTYQWFKEGLRLTGANLRLLACSSAVIVGGVVVAGGHELVYQVVYTVVALAAWAMLGTRRDEREALVTEARAWLRSRGLARATGIG
jgi:O-antigen/teichoic acid export membrane protein